MPLDVPPQIIDGDTFRLGSERVRILNIDAPEMPAHARCDAEGYLALAAKDRLSVTLLEAGKGLSVERHGRDRYGRTLALIRVSGADVGEILIKAHLAVPWGGKRHQWCQTPNAPASRPR